MKTKKLIIIAVFLLSGTFVSAQTYSDSNKQKNEITKNKFQSSDKPEIPAITTSYSIWWKMLISQFIPSIVGNDFIQSDDGANKKHQINGQPARELPRLPGPYRYSSIDSKEISGSR